MPSLWREGEKKTIMKKKTEFRTLHIKNEHYGKRYLVSFCSTGWYGIHFFLRIENFVSSSLLSFLLRNRFALLKKKSCFYNESGDSFKNRLAFYPIAFAKSKQSSWGTRSTDLSRSFDPRTSKKRTLKTKQHSYFSFHFRTLPPHTNAK